MTEYIARISYGKDSLKMLDVIKTRGLPLDRITTTDVWATDTISANLPPMDAFKERMDQRIWDMYRIEVEHLCARNPDGSKRTYEQQFYHVPVRRSQALNVERDGSGREQSADSHQTPGTNGVRNSKYHPGTGIKGWPLSNKRVQWCQALKTRVSMDFRHYGFRGAGEDSKSTCDKTPFLLSAVLQRAKTEMLWNTLALLQMNRNGMDS